MVKLKPLKYGVTSTVILLGLLTWAGCASPGAPSSSPPVTSTPTTQAPAPPTNPATNPGLGVRGSLTAIDGNTLTLTTFQGTQTVDISPSTTIQKTVTGSLSDLTNGETVTVIGTQDATGNIEASAVSIRPQGVQFTSPGGALGGAGGRPNRQGNSGNFTFSDNRTGRGASGNITSVDGNTVTLTTAQGRLTVNVTSTTLIEKTVVGTVSDLQVGEFLNIIESQDANGSVTVKTISIQPQGSGIIPPAAAPGT